MKVGILGSGDVGRALATGFVAAGHTVTIGAREREHPKLVEWAATTGGPGHAGTFGDAAKFGELLVVATLGVAAPEAVRRAGPALFEGKVVIDVTNPLEFTPSGAPALARLSHPSNGEMLQALLPKARVVKAFNIVGNQMFYRPSLPGGPPDMLIAGNDAAAKQTVTGVLHEFGWPSVIDLGGIEGARELESLCIAWVKSAFQLHDFDIAFKLLRK
jgi:predicted dinucleotide-binding enzyme